MTSDTMRQSVVLRLFAVLFILAISSQSFAQAPRMFITARGTLNFGTVKVGKDSTRSFYIFNTDSNRGPIHVQIIGPATSNFTLLTPSTFEVAPAKIDTVRISFTPQSAGSILDSIFIAHDADTTRSKNPTVLKLAGNGLSPSDTTPRIAVSVAGLQMTANIDSVRTARFVIRNTSDTMRYLVGSVRGIKAPFSFQSGDTLFSLPTGDSAVYVVKFAPTAAQTYTDTLHILSNTDSAHRDIPFTIRGTGIDPHPAISLSTRYVDFGVMTVGKDSVIELILGNTGNTGILYDTVIGPTSGPFSVVKGSGDSVRQPKKTLAIDVKFSPQVAGTFLDSLILNTNAASVDGHIVVSLNGIGEPAASVRVPDKAVAFQIDVVAHAVRVLNPTGYSGAEASVFDESGACRMTVPIATGAMTEVDLAPLPHGSYFVEVTAGNRSQIKRVVR